MKSAQFEEMVTKARQRTQESIEATTVEFGLGTYEHYKIDLPTAKIHFFDGDGVERVHADIQVAGSWSPESESWLWAWDNESIPEAASVRMAAVRSFGEENETEQLSESFYPCDEGEAWSMASVASQILDAQCVYRVARPTNQVFFLLFAIQRSV